MYGVSGLIVPTGLPSANGGFGVRPMKDEP
jgi:hypothetical protein